MKTTLIRMSYGIGLEKTPPSASAEERPPNLITAVDGSLDTTGVQKAGRFSSKCTRTRIPHQDLLPHVVHSELKSQACEVGQFQPHSVSSEKSSSGLYLSGIGHKRQEINTPNIVGWLNNGP